MNQQAPQEKKLKQRDSTSPISAKAYNIGEITCTVSQDAVRVGVLLTSVPKTSLALLHLRKQGGFSMSSWHHCLQCWCIGVGKRCGRILGHHYRLPTFNPEQLDAHHQAAGIPKENIAPTAASDPTSVRQICLVPRAVGKPDADPGLDSTAWYRSDGIISCAPCMHPHRRRLKNRWPLLREADCCAHRPQAISEPTPMLRNPTRWNLDINPCKKGSAAGKCRPPPLVEPMFWKAEVGSGRSVMPVLLIAEREHEVGLAKVSSL